MAKKPKVVEVHESQGCSDCDLREGEYGKCLHPEAPYGLDYDCEFLPDECPLRKQDLLYTLVKDM
jgi:hypothetical protein